MVGKEKEKEKEKGSNGEINKKKYDCERGGKRKGKNGGVIFSIN